MKALQIVTGSVAAGLAAAFLGGAFWAQDANIDPDRYVVSGDVISVVSARIPGIVCTPNTTARPG